MYVLLVKIQCIVGVSLSIIIQSVTSRIFKLRINTFHACVMNRTFKPCVDLFMNHR